MVIQNVFNTDSCNMIYFSPYTDIMVKGNALYLRRPGKMRIRLLLKNSAEDFLGRMNSGMTYYEITAALSSELDISVFDAEKIIRVLIKNRFLE